MNFIVRGGNPLHGQIKTQRSKNAILPIIACCIMCEGTVYINDCPRLDDIVAMADIITSMGGEARFENDALVINCKDIHPHKIDRSLTGRMRSSIFILGSIIARFKHASICYPGGCEIGLRPIDLHLNGLSALNVHITENGGVIECDGSHITSGNVALDFPSVGATENIMMAATLTDGRTTLVNAAREPEIIDLANFINAMGGHVEGAGSSTIVIEGVTRLKGGSYTPIPDRIFAGTILTAAAITQGSVTLTKVCPEHIFAITEKLANAGCLISQTNDTVSLVAPSRIRSVTKTETSVYPGFPTDMQPQFCALMTIASGTSVIVENLFENRFKYTRQLVNMGASITVKDRVAVIRGTKTLRPSILSSEDLRGGAALVLAALCVDGISCVENVRHIDRGYDHLENALNYLGADIKRV